MPLFKNEVISLNFFFSTKSACEVALSAAMKDSKEYKKLIPQLKQLQDVVNKVAPISDAKIGNSPVDTANKKPAKEGSTEPDSKKVLPDSSKIITNLSEKLDDEQSTSKMYKIFTLLFKAESYLQGT